MFGFLCVSINTRTHGLPEHHMPVPLSWGVAMGVTMWRCPACPLILVGSQIAGAEEHYATHEDGTS